MAMHLTNSHRLGSFMTGSMDMRTFGLHYRNSWAETLKYDGIFDATLFRPTVGSIDLIIS